MQVLSSIHSLFAANTKKIVSFRNFAYRDFGGLNLFEEGENMLQMVADYLQDNFERWIMQEGNCGVN